MYSRIPLNRFQPRAEQQNKPNLTDLPVVPALSAAAAQSGCDRNRQSRLAKIKIQAIYNGKIAPIAMQSLARTREKPPAQEQWVSMEKQCEKQWENNENTGAPEDVPWGCAHIAAKRILTALEKQNAPEAAKLRTRECHSALNAMRRSRRECKRNWIYPRYSRVIAS